MGAAEGKGLSLQREGNSVNVQRHGEHDDDDTDR